MKVYLHFHQGGEQTARLPYSFSLPMLTKHPASRKKSISFVIFVFTFLEKGKTTRYKVHVINMLLVTGMVAGYTGIIYKKYDVIAISSVSDINLYMMLRSNGMIRFSDTFFPFREYVSDKMHTHYFFHEASTIIKEGHWPELHAVIKETISKNSRDFLLNKTRMVYLDEALGVFFSYSRFNHFYKINYFHLFYLLLFYLFLMGCMWVKSKKIPVISGILFIYVFIYLITLFLSAPNHFGRLILPAMPIVLIMLSQRLEVVVALLRKKGKYLPHAILSQVIPVSEKE